MIARLYRHISTFSTSLFSPRRFRLRLEMLQSCWPRSITVMALAAFKRALLSFRSFPEASLQTTPKKHAIYPTDPEGCKRWIASETPCLTGNAKEFGTNFSEEIIDMIKAGTYRKACAILIILSQDSGHFTENSTSLDCLLPNRISAGPRP